MRTLVGTILAGVVLAATPALAGDAVKGPIAVSDAWARATPPQAPTGAIAPTQAPTGAAFLTLANTGADPDRLLAANAKVSRTVELHMHMAMDGVMRMRPVEAIDLRPGKVVTLEPGGLHVMLIGLDAPLRPGDSFPLTLVFETAGDVTVSVDVVGPGAMTGPAMTHDPKLHEEHMRDPAHRAMHERMHGGGT